MYRFPKGLKARLLGYFYTTDFDCPCEGKCNVTEISKELVDILFRVHQLYRYPFTIVKGYTCIEGQTDLDRAYNQGRGLILQAGDQERLYKILNKFARLSVTKDELNIYIILKE